MRDRGVARFEVERVLKAGAVVMIETDPGGREKWRVTGHDADGRRIEPVVEVRPPTMMILVTVIRID
jgi:isopentenyl diphosphate isomerase/L-lactate dehydrogenase-like FMN-dependent dehydrogenase